MKRRRASAEVLEPARPDPIPSPEPEPPSAFEAAEDLLLSALDEVRVAPAEPATSAAEQGAGSQVLTARRPYRRNRGLAHDLDAPSPVSTADAEADLDEAVRNAENLLATAFEKKSSRPDGAPRAAVDDIEREARAAERRRRAAPAAAAAPATIAAPADAEPELDPSPALGAATQTPSLRVAEGEGVEAEELDREPEPIRRRWRRPHTVAPAAAAGGVTIDAEPAHAALSSAPPIADEPTLDGVEPVSTDAASSWNAAELAPLTGERPLPTSTSSRPHTTTTRKRPPWFVIVAALAAVVLVAATAIAVSSGGDSGAPEQAGAPSAPRSVKLAFDPVTTPEGLQLERVWTLRGSQGSDFVGTLTFSNPTAASVHMVHTEVIPKSLARNVGQITFDPQPTTIVDPDPVVQYSENVGGNEDFTITYTIDVAADGADQSRLRDWADDVDQSGTTRSTTTTSSTSSTSSTTSTTLGSRSSSGSSGSSSGSTGAPSGGSSLAPPPAPAAAPAPPPPPPPPPDPKPDPSPPDNNEPSGNGAILIQVSSREGTGTFGFSGPGGSVSVTTSGSPHGEGKTSMMTVAAGKYTWKQVSASGGFGVLNIDCTDRDAGPFDQRSTVSGTSATFNVQPGETVSCTWTNRR